ncbi:hypothetical protein HNP84_003193 [Thermocatellispora tengchongensis]|uniref:Uncharacterized protein n=1 Tax=Thermocatellispora tengchongensis TaxID=1073253 RepID=A0A840P8D5_9ACTN|nr:hypothetical protein [Thermocatellispora tengchongensis]MBB5133467.1 hypothetical protein [Thermocatellispora tengchongensis]
MGAKRARDGLSRAYRTGGRPIRVGRSIAGADEIDAYVVGVGRKWALLHVVSGDMRLDGYAAVRLRHVERASSAGWKGSAVAHRALGLRGERPARVPGLDLDTTAGLIGTMAAAFGLIGVYVEEADPGVCYVGVPRGITRGKRLRLQEIDSGAEWDRACTTTRLAEITRLDAGGGYLDALAAVGGPAPAWRVSGR